MEQSTVTNFNRLLINTIKQAFAEFAAQGSIDVDKLNNTHKQLNFELDRRVVAKEPTEEIEALIKDVLWLKYDLLGAQC